MKILFRNKKVGVQKLKTKSNKNSGFYVQPESEEFLGVVKYVSSDSADDIKVGDKVYFLSQFQQAQMEGASICVMDDTNIYAIVNEEEKTENSQS